MTSRIMRKKEVCRITGLSASTLWRLEHAGKFPRRVKISNQAVGWFQDAVELWLEKRQPLEASASDNLPDEATV